MNKERPLHIFLCHASSDKAVVRALYRRLRTDGFAPWLDEENLLPGQDWRRIIPQAVRGSDIVLVCLSKSSINKSGYVQKEIKFALDVAEEQPEDTIYIIPVKLEECNVPDRLSEWQWVNLFEEGGYKRLIQSLQLRANIPSAVNSTESTPKTNQNVVKNALRSPLKDDSDSSGNQDGTLINQTLGAYQSASPIASWIFGSALLLFLMAVVFVDVQPTKFPIIRFFMALVAAFFAVFFVGGVLLKGTLNGLLISATGGIVLFILIQFVFDPFSAISSYTPTSTPSPTATPTSAITPLGSPTSLSEANPGFIVGDTGAFTIEVQFSGDLTRKQKDAFKTAANRWTRVIVGDLPSERVDDEVIDDLLIQVQGAQIDGPGNLLGQAGPTKLRPDSAGSAAFLPVKGTITIDVADLAQMEKDGRLENLATHLIGRVLGLGTVWSEKNLIKGAGTNNPVFVGKNAQREYVALLGSSEPRPVPVENIGGPGTADSGWRESVFMNEVMTGFMSSGYALISRVTVGALEDMGYKVNYDGADNYKLPNLIKLSWLWWNGKTQSPT